MHDSSRYRDMAAQCLLATERGSEPYSLLSILMAQSWLLLARQDEAMDNLIAGWTTAQPTLPIAA